MARLLSSRVISHSPWYKKCRSDHPALDWTPDARTIVFNGDRSENVDSSYQSSQLFAVDVASETVRDVLTKPGDWNRPVVSPDGRLVAFTGFTPSGRTHTVSDLWVMPLTASGGAAGDMRKISGDFDRNPINLRWAPDGRGVYFDADDRGARNVVFASVVGGVKVVTAGRQMLSFDSMSTTLVAAGVSSDLAHPEDIVKVDLKQPSHIMKLTDVNGDVLQGKQLGAVEEITYTSSGNAKVMAWVTKPPSFDATKKYPLILEIHGGPFANYNVGFNYMFQNFAANGFVVLTVNPRGSTSYGSDFINGIDHNYPGPDYDDLMAGVDTVVGKGYIDQTRMYVSGCSGGGVLSSWGVIGRLLGERPLDRLRTVLGILKLTQIQSAATRSGASARHPSPAPPTALCLRDRSPTDFFPSTGGGACN
jgi:dipeptidyl aminopeptidase/acylaminoacyl peptidase